MPNDPVIVPGQQSTDPGQQTPPAPASTPPAVPQTPPSGFVEQERFSGAIRKIEELTTAQRTKELDLQAKLSEIERLKAELANRDIEKTVAVGERDRAYQAALQEGAALKHEVEQLKAFQLKVEVAKEIGHPELLTILHTIPDLTDREVLKNVMGDFVRFREEGVTARERQLFAGITPPISPIVNAPAEPASDEEWQRRVNGLAVGSKERQQAFDAWFEWQHKPK